MWSIFYIPLLKKCLCIGHVFSHSWCFPGEVWSWRVYLQKNIDYIKTQVQKFINKQRMEDSVNGRSKLLQLRKFPFPTLLSQQSAQIIMKKSHCHGKNEIISFVEQCKMTRGLYFAFLCPYLVQLGAIVIVSSNQQRCTEWSYTTAINMVI